MTVKTNFNPVGKIPSLPGIDLLIKQMKQEWQAIVAQFGKVNWAIGVNFLLKCLDDSINYMVQYEIPGEDKKATVLMIISQVYDWVIVPLFPFWFKPFLSTIKDYMINVVTSAAIDWIVSKYQKGSWKPKEDPVV